MKPYPLDNASLTALCKLRPNHVKSMQIGEVRVWIDRYQEYPTAVVSAWATEDFSFNALAVWFPSATANAVRAWVETLEQPVPVVAE